MPKKEVEKQNEETKKVEPKETTKKKVQPKTTKGTTEKKKIEKEENTKVKKEEKKDAKTNKEEMKEIKPIKKKKETTKNEKIVKEKKDNIKNETEELPKKEKEIKKEITVDSVIKNENPIKEELKKESLTKKVVEKESKSSKNEFRTLEVGVLVLLTCIISLIVGSGLGMKFSEKIVDNEEKETPTTNAAMRDFIKEYNYLIDNYYGEIDEKELLNTAFKSVVDSLEDAYSGTIDDNTSNNFDIELEGHYDGLGVEIINDENKNILIYSIIPNSPASRVDLQKGDKLITVNGIEVSGMVTTDFVNNIVKGSGATDFTIVYERNGEQKSVTIKKEGITLQSVTSKTYEENGKKIGYLKVTLFAANTYDQFKKELTALEENGIDSLIIDLRDNNGGHLTSVQNMISLFLDSSHVIYQTQDKKKTTKVYSTGKKTKQYPIAIVGNALSASASEVMIAALTEEYGAVLIGNQSFGKGTVQELHELSNGDEYKFTTKKWLTPKGNWVHNNGIMPTIEVTLAKEYYDNPVEENDNQLRAALDYLKEKK